jgi:ABC-type transport system involved in multi-copper enzyme maturation permease subunit
MNRWTGSVLAIAINTWRDAIRSKVLYVLLFFALLLIATSATLATLSYVERDRILQDVSLGAIRFFGAAIAIFVGVGLVHREVDRRTIFTILSKPVERSAFIAGKYLGFVATLWALLAVMSLGFAGASLAADAPLNAGHAIALGLIALEFAVVVAFATLFSSFATPFLAGCYSLGIYIVGHLTRDLYAIGQVSDSPAARQFTLWVKRLVPDLEAFNRTIEAVHGLPIPPAEVGYSLVLGICWIFGFLLVAVMTFERRDFR